MGLYRIFRKIRLPYAPAMILVIICMVLYGRMTGMSSSSGRAILMFAIRLNAKRVGRTYDMLTALAVAAVLLVIEQPLYVTYVGFQLSFGAIVGLGCLMPALEAVFGKYAGNISTNGLAAYRCMCKKTVRKIIGRMQGAVYGNLSVMLVTFPVLLYHYYEYSVYAILLNLMVLPTMGILVGAAAVLLGGGAVTGFLSGIATSLFTKPGRKFLPAIVRILLEVTESMEYTVSFLCTGMLWLYRNGGKRLLMLPGAVRIIGKPHIWQIALYITAMLLFMILSAYAQFRQRSERSGTINCKVPGVKTHAILHGIKEKSLVRMTGLVLLIAAVLCLTAVPKIHGLEITFLDVGQGDGICIQEKDGHGILIDCGSTDRRNVGQNVLIPFLKSKGIHTLDAVFLSHLDNDHINGIVQIMEQGDGIRIHRIILSAYIPKDEAWKNLVDITELYGIQISYMRQEEGFGNEQLQFICIAPGDGSVTGYAGNGDGSVTEVSGNGDGSVTEVSGNGDRNGNSLVLLMKYGNFQTVFTGDADAEEEEQALEIMTAFENWENDRSNACMLLKVSHHGSKTASGENFLKTLQPELAVISCGKNNSYGHPHTEVLERLTSVGVSYFCTKDYGAVTVSVTDNGKVTVSGYRKK